MQFGLPSDENLQNVLPSNLIWMCVQKYKKKPLCLKNLTELDNSTTDWHTSEGKKKCIFCSGN